MSLWIVELFLKQGTVFLWFERTRVKLLRDRYRENFTFGWLQRCFWSSPPGKLWKKIESSLQGQAGSQLQGRIRTFSERTQKVHVEIAGRLCILESVSTKTKQHRWLVLCEENKDSPLTLEYTKILKEAAFTEEVTTVSYELQVFVTRLLLKED